MASKNDPKFAQSPGPSEAPAPPVVAVSDLYHEVLVTQPNGHQTVERVTASSKAEAERIVSERLGLTAQRRAAVTEVTSPADLRKREQEAQRAMAERTADAQRERAERDR
jgi:hypothetical protein